MSRLLLLPQALSGTMIKAGADGRLERGELNRVTPLEQLFGALQLFS